MKLGDRNHLAFIDSIAVGCMAAIASRRAYFSLVQTHLFAVIGLLLLVLVLLFRGMLYKAGISSLGLNITMLSLGVGLIVLWLHKNHELGKGKVLMGSRWLSQMGVFSYEIYLTHMFVVILGAQLYKKLELDENWLVPYCLGIAVVAYLLGMVLFKYFSEPLNVRLRRKRRSRMM